MSAAMCPQCGTASKVHFVAKDENRRVSEQNFTYYRCPECGVIFLLPVPDNLGDYYTDSYHQIPRNAEDLASAVAYEGSKVAIVQQFVRSGRLLEIGPSFGSFALAAKQAGFTVHAVEMDAACCRFLREQVRVSVTQSADVPRAVADLGQFDVIALWHVFEHLTDAWPTFDALAQHLGPGGILVIATPNPNAIQARLWGKFWAHLDAPRHVMLIPADTLITRAKRLHLEMVFATTADRGSLYLNTFGWQASLRNWAQGAQLKRIAWPTGRFISRLFRPVERHGMQGSAYTLVFRRPR